MSDQSLSAAMNVHGPETEETGNHWSPLGFRKNELFTMLGSTIMFKVDLYDLVIFDHFWPSEWRGNRDEF